MRDLSGNTYGHFMLQSLLRADPAFAVYQARDLKTPETNPAPASKPEEGSVPQEVESQENPAAGKVWFWGVFPNQPALSETFSQRFLDRLNLLSLLDHPNIVPILEFGQEQDVIYWVTPEVEGQLLSEVLNRKRSEKDAARIAEGAASAVAYLHEQDILHGGLSPEFVILGPEEEVYLYNYGMAALMNPEIFQMVPESMVGFGMSSPAYLAPEQIIRQEISIASDIYALGALYFALLIGRGPRETGALVETALKQIADPPAWPRKLPVKVSQTSVRLIHKCLSKQPSDRYKRASDVQRILERLLRGGGSWIRLRKAQLAGAPRPSPWLLRITLLVVILALAGLMVVWRSSLPESWSFLFPIPISTLATPLPVTVELAATTATPVPPTNPSAPSPTSVQATAAPSPERYATPQQPGVPTPTSPPVVQPASDGYIQPVLVNMPVAGMPQVIQAGNITQVQEILRLGYGKFNQVAQSPDDQTIAIASTAGVFILGRSGGISAFLDPQDEASCVAFSPYDGTLAVGLRLGDIQIWDWKAHQKVKTLKGHTGRISRILFSPNKRNLISSSYDLYIKVWDIASGTEYKSVKAHPLPIHDIALTTGDGRYLASVSDDTRVLVWDINTLKSPTEFSHPAPSSVTFSDDGQFLAVGGRNGEIRQWNISARQYRSFADPIFMTRAVTGLVYDNSTASTLRVALDDGSVTTAIAVQKSSFTVHGSAEVPTTPKELYDKLGNDFEFTVNSAFKPGITGPTIKWDGSLNAATGFKFPSPTEFEDFKKIFFSPDSRLLLAGGPLSHVYLWNVAENKMGGMKPGDLASGNPFSSDSRLIALTERSRIYGTDPRQSGIVVDTACLFSSSDLTQLQVLSSIPIGGSLQFTKGDSLLVAETATQVKFWDVKSGLDAEAGKGNDSGCELAKSANDGTVLSVFSPIGMMSTWDEKTRLLCNLGGRGGTRWAFFSADRKFLIYENTNGLLELYNIEANAVAWKIPFDREIATVAFSPDDSLIALGAADGTLTFLDTQTQAQLRVIQAHPRPIRSVAFSRDGKRLATGSADGTVRVWAVLPGFGQ